MRVRFAAPIPELRESIQVYWSWSSDRSIALPRTYPSIHTEIVIHYDSSLRADIGDGRRISVPRVHIVGPGVPYTDLHARGRVEFFAIRLMPGVLGRLCGLPAGELRGEIAPLGDVCVELIRALNPVLDAQDFPTRTVCANRILKDMLRRGMARRMDALSLFTEPSPEEWSVKNMARAAGWSERHLGRVFRHEVGVAPLEFLRLLRFQNTLFRIAAKPDIDLTELALEGGFYDQAHLTSEVRRFSGRTPAFLKRNTIPHDLFFPFKPERAPGDGPRE